MYIDNMIPIKKGTYNLTSGTHSAGGFICQEDGVLTIVDVDDVETTLAVSEGGSYRFNSDDFKTITITSGKFIKVW